MIDNEKSGKNEEAAAAPSGGPLARAWHGIRRNFLQVIFDYPFLLWIGLIALIAELGYAMLNIATLPLHLDIDLHAAWATGWVLASFLLVEAIFKSPFGALGDRIGRRPLLIAGPMWSGLCCWAMYYANSAWQFILLQGLNGLGFAAFWPSCFSTIADRVQRRDMTRAMSVFNLTYMFGIALGPLAKALTSTEDVRAQVIGRITKLESAQADARWLNNSRWDAFHSHGRLAHHVINNAVIRTRVTAHLAGKSDYDIGELAATLHITNQHRFPFLIVAVLFLTTSLLSILLAARQRPAAGGVGSDSATIVDSSPTVDPHAPVKETLMQQVAIGMKTIPWMMAIAFFIFMGVGFLSPCMEPYFLKVYGATEKQFGVMMLPIMGIIGVMALPMGRLGDRWGTTRSVRTGMLACAVGMWCAVVHPLLIHLHGMPAFLGSFWIMALIVAIVGLGFVMASPAWMARVTEMAPPHLRGAVLGAASMAQGCGALLGGVVGGHLWAIYSNTRFPEAPMLGCAIMLTIGSGLALWQVRDEVGV